MLTLCKKALRLAIPVDTPTRFGALISQSHTCLHCARKRCWGGGYGILQGLGVAPAVHADVEKCGLRDLQCDRHELRLLPRRQTMLRAVGL